MKLPMVLLLPPPDLRELGWARPRLTEEKQRPRRGVCRPAPVVAGRECRGSAPCCSECVSARTPSARPFSACGLAHVGGTGRGTGSSPERRHCYQTHLQPPGGTGFPDRLALTRHFFFPPEKEHVLIIGMSPKQNLFTTFKYFTTF